MRVLLTTDTVGGVWTFTRELAVGLLERGHGVALVSLGREPSNSQLAWALKVEQQYGAAFCYEASGVPLEWMEANEAAYSGVEELLLRMIEQFQVEVVHASQFCFGALPVTMPKVVTAHSDVLSWAEACRPSGLKESDWLCRYRGLVHAGIEGADVVVAPTQWMCNALLRHFPSCSNVQVILNGRTLPTAPRSKLQRLQAVTVGRVWDEGKGLAVLRQVDRCIPVLVVGEDRFEGEQAPRLRAVEFLARLDESEVLEIMRKSSLYLATSIYEPFGLAPLEAALCGCGVIARDITSLREVWGDAAEYFTSSGTLSGLIMRMRDLPAELEALRDRSMERALELSAARMVDGYLAQYEHLLMISAREEVAAYAG